MGLFTDLRYAVRQLHNSPVFLIAVVVTLAVGIGANAAMFGVIDTLLFRPPALVRDPETLVRVHAQMPARPGEPSDISGVFSYPDYLDLKERAAGFSAVVAFARSSVTVSDESGQSVAVAALAVTGDYFATLGVAARRGRVLSTDDAKRDGAEVVVLSHDYWQRRLGGADGILGRSIRVNQHLYTVVGVAPVGFSGTDPGVVALWLPLAKASQLGFGAELMRSRSASWLSIVARIAPGVTRQQAVDAAQRAIGTARYG